MSNKEYNSYVTTLKNKPKELETQITVSDTVISIMRDSFVNELVPITTYVDVLKSEHFGSLSLIQKEKLNLVSIYLKKLTDRCLGISVEEIRNIDNLVNDTHR